MDTDSISLISFFSLHELFAGFFCPNNAGNIANSLFGVRILIPGTVFCILLFRGINFTLPAIVSPSYDFIYKIIAGRNYCWKSKINASKKMIFNFFTLFVAF